MDSREDSRRHPEHNHDGVKAETPERTAVVVLARPWKTASKEFPGRFQLFGPRSHLVGPVQRINGKSFLRQFGSDALRSKSLFANVQLGRRKAFIVKITLLFKAGNGTSDGFFSEAFGKKFVGQFLLAMRTASEQTIGVVEGSKERLLIADCGLWIWSSECDVS